MSKTNFAALTTEQKKVWSRDLWKQARNLSFLSRFTGKGSNSMIQRITELTKSEKGDRAVLTLVADLETDGVAGDDQLEGNEEEIKAYDQVIRIDQLRQANRHKGRMAEQRSIVNFREQSRDVLAYWLADRMDQLGFLTLSGVANGAAGYAVTNRGAARAANSGFIQLDFAADVTQPSTNRYTRWDAVDGLKTAGASNADLVAADTPTWAMLVELKALAKERYIRGIKGAGGGEYYHVFMTPTGMAKLRQDPDYLANVRNAGVRGSSNELFAGTDTSILVDGLMIHEYRHVYNTTGAASGSKWGAGGLVDGQRVIIAGAQALGMVDLGAPEWVEETFDFGNQQAISVAKMFGLLKPKFRSSHSG
ncbi:MAG: N4-gp56 family major capsid protein, partial [Cyanobium sp.]|nr:N4-gp56 family major capsid protein [Cyanobium sp.]